MVNDYDEAILFFTQKLGFALIEDTHLDGGKRWVVVAPKGGSGTSFVLARASDERQRAAVGNQAGGRVAFFLRTEDFWRDYRNMSPLESRSSARRRPKPTARSPCSRTYTEICGTSW